MVESKASRLSTPAEATASELPDIECDTMRHTASVQFMEGPSASRRSCSAKRALQDPALLSCGARHGSARDSQPPAAEAEEGQSKENTAARSYQGEASQHSKASIFFCVATPTVPVAIRHAMGDGWARAIKLQMLGMSCAGGRSRGHGGVASQHSGVCSQSC